MNNKISLIMITSVIIVLALSACGRGEEVSSNAEENIGSAQVESSSGEVSSKAISRPGIDMEFQDAMPISAQLGFGTLLLEDTEYAVDPDQAAELLPLWKATRSLSGSETVAQEELEAVFNQIQDTMTTEQINAIAEMQLTGEEMVKLMEDLGLSFEFGGLGFGNLTPEQQATTQAARESGEGFPGGNFLGGGIPGSGPGGQGPGGPGFAGGNLTPEQQATMESRRAERGSFGTRFALIFVDPLIDLLEERAAE